MIPLITFQQATVPEAVIKMAEQTMVVAFRSYQGWLFRPVEVDGVVPSYAIQQHWAQFMRPISKPVHSAVRWPALTHTAGLQYEQPIVRVSETSPGSMHPHGAKGQSIYKNLHNISTSANHLLATSEQWEGDAVAAIAITRSRHFPIRRCRIHIWQALFERARPKANRCEEGVSRIQDDGRQETTPSCLDRRAVRRPLQKL